MKPQLLHWMERLRASFWLLPALMMASAILSALGLLALDQALNINHLPGFRWLALRDHDSARAILSTIAGSTITVAGTVFSITTVALTLAAILVVISFLVLFLVKGILHRELYTVPRS